MSIISTDLLIKSCLEAAIADIRANTWLLDDIFGGLATDPLTSVEYGFKEAEQAKRWVVGNNIPVYLHARVDNPTFPCLSVVQNSSVEAMDRTSFGDFGREEEVHPRTAIQQPQKVYPNFTPEAYDPVTGTVTFPGNLNTDNMVVGQFLVSQSSGRTYKINSIESDNSFNIDSSMYDDFTGAFIIPAKSLWNLNREITHFNESFTVGCHAQSDPVQCIWLRQLVMYILLRYKEAYLEARGFALSTLSAQGMDVNPHFEVERVFTAVINLSGVIEGNWIKYIAPKLQGIRAFAGGQTPNAVGMAMGQTPPNPVKVPNVTTTVNGPVNVDNFRSGVHIADATPTPDQYKEEVFQQGWDTDPPTLGDEEEEEPGNIEDEPDGQS